MTEKVITLTAKSLSRFKYRTCYICGKELHPGDVVVFRRKTRRAERRLAHKEC